MATDPYTSSLLHFNGNDGEDTFTDETSKVWSHVGSAHTGTLDPKFGSASGHFTGDGGLNTLTHADFVFGNGDFTIDFWVKCSTATGNMCFVLKALNGYNYAPWSVFKLAGALALTFYSASGTSSWDICNGVTIGTLTSGVWAHVAIVRNGTNIVCYLNGVVGSTTAVATKTVLNNANAVHVGTDGTYYHSTSQIDELRISKGVARWTADFSASLPDAEYVADTDSSLTLPLLQLAI
jgi:hypothetical protein